MTMLSQVTPSWVAVTRLLICDQRAAARTVLARVIAETVPTVADTESSTHAADLVARYAVRPADLVLIGIHGKSGGIESVERLLAAYPAARIIVYGCVNDAQAISVAIRRGARGFLAWDINNLAASPARQRPSNIGRFTTRSEKTKVPAPLTERELQILRGMTRGHSNGEIGKKLFLSEDTVKTHARRLFQKLGANDRAHAVALGLRAGLVA